MPCASIVERIKIIGYTVTIIISICLFIPLHSVIFYQNHPCFANGSFLILDTLVLFFYRLKAHLTAPRGTPPSGFEDLNGTHQWSPYFFYSPYKVHHSTSPLKDILFQQNPRMPLPHKVGNLKRFCVNRKGQEAARQVFKRLSAAI